MGELAPTDDQILAVVLQRLLAALPEETPVTALDARTPLDTFGVDSLGLVALLVDLEGHWSVTVPAELITREAFATAGTVAETFRSVLQGSELDERAQ